jgi:hypothetical protein
VPGGAPRAIKPVTLYKRIGGTDAQRDHRVGMHIVQEKQLFAHEEQTKAFGASRTEKILPVRTETYGSQRSALNTNCLFYFSRFVPVSMRRTGSVDKYLAGREWLCDALQGR